MSNTASDRTIIRFLSAKMEAKGAGGGREVIPDSNTAARDRETKDPRNVLSWAAEQQLTRIAKTYTRNQFLIWTWFL